MHRRSLFLPDNHPLGRIAKRYGYRVQVNQGVFGILRRDGAERYSLGVYPKGLRSELEDSAELTRLKALGWRLEIIDAAAAPTKGRIEDFFSSWRWPLARIEESLREAMIAERI